jgi:hypothetical protein
MPSTQPMVCWLGASCTLHTHFIEKRFLKVILWLNIKFGCIASAREDRDDFKKTKVITNHRLRP